MTVLGEIAEERWRQQEAEGWTPEHDDQHAKGELAAAAAAYAFEASLSDHIRDKDWSNGETPACWPWSREWWKPKDRRRDLIRAAALLVAEVERLDRLSAAAP